MTTSFYVIIPYIQHVKQFKIRHRIYEYKDLVLEKYASFFRISKNEAFASVSLYELTRYLAAMVTVEEELLDHEKPHLLVAADLSGIQAFIYTIASSGALKSLRGRSFFLELLIRHVIDEILSVGVTSTAVFMQGGGGFTMVLPNTKTVRNTLEAIRVTINDWLLEELQGRIYLSLTWLPITPEQTLFPSFDSAWQEIGSLLEENKSKKHICNLSSLLEIREPVQKGKEEECQICHRDDMAPDQVGFLKDGELRVCSFCKAMYDAGDDLTDFKYVKITKGEDKDFEGPYLIPGLKGLINYGVVNQKSETGDYYIKNSLELSEYHKGRCKSLFYADYVISEKDLDLSKSDKMTANLEDLASKSYGKKLLGSLRMDLDHLSLNFTKGFNQSGDILRYSALSRQLGYFFTIYLSAICQAEIVKATNVFGSISDKKGRLASIIYAGGDDLFITGAWSSIIELAVDIASCLKEYVNSNPDFSISGGLILTKPDYPIYQIARLSGEAEEKAKQRLPLCAQKNCSDGYLDCQLLAIEGASNQLRCLRHNAAVLFYSPARSLYLSDLNKDEALAWEEMSGGVIPLVQKFSVLQNTNISDHLELEYLPRGFVKKLYSIVEKWEQKGMLYLPLLHYLVRRMRDALSSRLNDQKSDPAIKEQIEDLLGQKNKNKGALFNQDSLKYLWPCLTWVDFLSRDE